MSCMCAQYGLRVNDFCSPGQCHACHSTTCISCEVEVVFRLVFELDPDVYTPDQHKRQYYCALCADDNYEVPKNYKYCYSRTGFNYPVIKSLWQLTRTAKAKSATK